MILIPSELLGKASNGGGMPRDLHVLSLDGGSVFNCLSPDPLPGSSPGTLHVCRSGQDPDPAAFGRPNDIVRIIAQPADGSGDGPLVVGAQGVCFTLRGFVLRGGRWEEMPVQAIAIGSELGSRLAGILETNALKDAAVYQPGLGSGGSPIIIDLAKAGVGTSHIMDPDRLEVGNVSRHMAGLRDVGRYKTQYAAEAIRQKNPYATVHTYEQRICWENAELIRGIVRRVELVISAVDDRRAIVLLNKICVEEKKTLIIPGAFRRAYGGQVLVVRPGISPCYECFRRILPERAMDSEISNSTQAEQIAYADRPVPIEPGLSSDILPISTMVVKLALTELLRTRATTLRSLEQDLVAPWYLWLNRREPGTDYEKLEPLGCHLDGMHILRWYGIDLERRPDCPCCGDFVGAAYREEGIQVSNEDVMEFAGE